MFSLFSNFLSENRLNLDKNCFREKKLNECVRFELMVGDKLCNFITKKQKFGKQKFIEKKNIKNFIDLKI